jgi:acetoacetate decarboxylase
MPHSTGFGSYTGSAQAIPVRLQHQIGNYTHAMFLDAHPPIARGRELWGFPQKLAAPSLKLERDTLVGALYFGPSRVGTGTMGYKHKELACMAVTPILERSNVSDYRRPCGNRTEAVIRSVSTLSLETAQATCDAHGG